MKTDSLTISHSEDLKQGSDAWLEWRKKGLGSSDAPIIMGVSPWTTPSQLLKQKLGLAKPKESNWAMERGNRLEPLARAHYQILKDMDMVPLLMEHPTHSWMRASLDGYNGENGGTILEIKCPGKKDHDLALQGKIPEKYKWQLVHQALVSGAKQIDYFSFDGESGVIVPFHFEEIDDAMKLLNAETAFWELIKNHV